MVQDFEFKGWESGVAPEAARAKRFLDRLAQPGFDLYLHAMGLSESHLGLLTSEVREAVDRAPYPKRDAIVTLQGDFTEHPEDLVPLVSGRLEHVKATISKSVP